MKKQVLSSNTKSSHLLSHGVISNGFIFVSGQIHADLDMKLVEGTVKEQMDQIMANVADVLHAAQSNIDNIVKVTIYVTDMSLMPEINEIYPSYFTGILPAREAVCVKALPLGANIEVSVVAEA